MGKPVPIIAHEGEVVLPVKVVKQIPRPGPNKIPLKTRREKTLNPERILEKEKHMLYKQFKAGLITEQRYYTQLKRALERYSCMVEDFGNSSL